MTTAAATGARAARWFTVVRGGYGAALVCVPGPLVSLAGGRPASEHARFVARVLGARQVAQAALTAGAASRAGSAALALGAETDLAHAVSMLGLALTGPPRRRIALLDALAATTLAAAGVLVTRQAARNGGPAPARATGMRAADVAPGPLSALARCRAGVAGWIAAKTIPAPVSHWLLGQAQAASAPAGRS